MSTGSDTAAALRVLVVDDDHHVAALHTRAVEQLDGVRVVGIAHTAAAAREMASRERVDVIVLDLGLPDAHGLSVAEAVRQFPLPRPAVIVVSADGDVGTREAARRVGVSDYIVKPFRLRELQDRVAAYRMRMGRA